MPHLSHEGRLSAHVGPCDEDARGTAFHLTFTATGAADEDVIRDEVVAEEGLGDTRVTGSVEVNEGCHLVVILGEHHLWPGHWSVSTLAVA